MTGKRLAWALAASAVLGIAAPAAGARPEGHGRACEGGDRGDGSCSEHRDCDRNEGQCSDDDFSPSFEDSPVIVCLPGSTCNF